MDNNYEKMGIYDLRNYARMLGVTSPTTLKRNQLIEKIEEIIQGKKPDSVVSKKGRPPKHSKDENAILDILLPNNMFDTGDDIRYKPIFISSIKTSFENVLSESSGFAENNILFKGFFRDYSNDFGLACEKGYVTNYYKENTIILKKLSNSYDLKCGDYIEGTARYIASKQLLLATDILYINDISVSSFKERENYENIIPCYPNKKLVLDEFLNEKMGQFKMARGQRIVFDIENSQNRIEFVKCMLKSLSETNDLRTLLVSIDDALEDIGAVMQNCRDVEICKLSTLQTRTQFFERVFTYVSNCIKRIECEQDVAIVFYDTQKFLSAYAKDLMLTENLTEQNAYILALNKLKDVFNLAKNTQNGSLTILMFDAQNLLEDLPNCKIVFNDDNLQADKSYVKNAEKITD